MIGFFETQRDTVAIGEIISIGDLRIATGFPGGAHQVRLRDGTERTLGEHQLRGLLRRVVTTFPAEPRTSLLRFSLDDDADDIFRTPVLGWAVCLDGQVRPILPVGVYDDYHDFDRGGFGAFVEMPSGLVESISEWSDFSQFDNAERMIIELREAKAARTAGGAS